MQAKKLLCLLMVSRKTWVTEKLKSSGLKNPSCTEQMAGAEAGRGGGDTESAMTKVSKAKDKTESQEVADKETNN